MECNRIYGKSTWNRRRRQCRHSKTYAVGPLSRSQRLRQPRRPDRSYSISSVMYSMRGTSSFSRDDLRYNRTVPGKPRHPRSRRATLRSAMPHNRECAPPAPQPRARAPHRECLRRRRTPRRVSGGPSHRRCTTGTGSAPRFPLRCRAPACRRIRGSGGSSGTRWATGDAAGADRVGVVTKDWKGCDTGGGIHASRSYPIVRVRPARRRRRAKPTPISPASVSWCMAGCVPITAIRRFASGESAAAVFWA